MGEEVRRLKVGPIGCSETALNDYQSTLRNTPEERSSHLMKFFF